MNLLDYNLKQLRKTYYKKYENYIISRIFHGINSVADDIQMITQQYVKRDSGCALIDLYLPQFKIQIEIDEPHHSKEDNKILDLNRELEIIDALGLEHTIERIKIEGKNIQQLNQEVDKLINDILLLRKSVDFIPWKLNEEYIDETNFSKYIDKGFIQVNDNLRFRKISDAANCLGQEVKEMQRAFFRSKKYQKKCLWFPKFYKNNSWDNKLVDDPELLKFHNLKYGDLIQEKPENKEVIKSHVENLINEESERVVFPRFIDNLGYVVYKFMGIYKVDQNLSSLNNGMFYRRINEQLNLI